MQPSSHLACICCANTVDFIGERLAVDQLALICQRGDHLNGRVIAWVECLFKHDRATAGDFVVSLRCQWHELSISGELCLRATIGCERTNRLSKHIAD
jgi:hypothetical protein